MKSLEQLETIVIAGFRNYGNYLQKFWPAQWNDWHEPKERNITLYVGYELLKNGFCVYNEVPANSKNSRIDMVAIKDRTMILFEAKRFYDIDEAKSINYDIGKMHKYKIKNKLFISEPIATELIYCILAQTLKDRVWVDCWKENKIFPNKRGSAWAELHQNLKKAKFLWGEPIYIDAKYPTEYKLFGLAAFFTKS